MFVPMGVDRTSGQQPGEHHAQHQSARRIVARDQRFHDGQGGVAKAAPARRMRDAHLRPAREKYQDDGLSLGVNFVVVLAAGIGVPERFVGRGHALDEPRAVDEAQGSDGGVKLQEGGPAASANATKFQAVCLAEGRQAPL
jgi:hypothetical protein